MEIDKIIYKDIKKLFFKARNFILSCLNYKFKIFKWILIILALFILYKVFKIINYRKVTRRLPVVNKTVYIKNSGNYIIGLYLNLRRNYFSRRDIITNVFFEANKNKILSLVGALRSYDGTINFNQDALSKFNSESYRYRHLQFTSRITNFKSGDHIFFFFYLDFDRSPKLERLLYTPVDIPMLSIIRAHIVLANIINNSSIEPEIKINKFIYFYPRFITSGAVNNIKAVFAYKYKSKMFLSKSVYLYNGEPVNVYKILKNKRNNINLQKVIISYKTAAHKRGKVVFTSLQLIEPDISSLGEVFKNFIFKTYFKNFMQKSNVFKNELKKLIQEGEKNNIPAKTIKEKIINNTINQIFFIDYNTKIKHISNIHNKIIRAFYRFVYKKYVRRENFIEHMAGLFHHKKTFYKNILIPIESSSINLVKNNKTDYLIINFKKLKLYKYFTNNKTILNSITQDGRRKFNSLTLRGSNRDYWYGKFYYKTYPLLNKVKVFNFITKQNIEPLKIASYFYFDSIPYAYPKFLICDNRTDGNYNDILKIINKYNKLGAYNFFNGSKLDYLMTTKLLHLENSVFSTNKFLLLEQFIHRKKEVNKIFKDDGGWIYRRIYLKKGLYYIDFLKTSFLGLKMLTLKKQNEK